MEDSIRIKVALDKFELKETNFSLKNIYFELLKGEAIALLGASGSGKTTLLKVIDGLYKNYEGQILLDGDELKKLHPREIYKKMGLLFQNPEEQLFAETVEEDVAFGPRNMGFGEEKIRESVTYALKLVNLSGFEKRPLHKLSFGEKKRVALAGLLAMGHSILLLDEPTLGLDPLLEASFLELLLNLKERGYSIIMATHNVDMVPIFADKVLIIKNGAMVLYGNTREILGNSKDLYRYNLRPPIITDLFKSLKESYPQIPIAFSKKEALDILLSLLAKNSS